MSISKKAFGQDLNGREMTLFTMTNHSGAKVCVTDYGAHLVGVSVPDRNGDLRDVVLGYDTLDEYVKNPSYLGATVGRFCNRIGGARFSLDGKDYVLYANEGMNTLHGGKEGFDRKWFKPDILEANGEDMVLFTYISHDGEEGYPGKLHFQVSFSWDDDNTLTLRYMAESDKSTVVNFTNHAYFNLAGHNSGDIRRHTLCVNAREMTEVDDQLIPTGSMIALDGSALDLKTAKVLETVFSASDDPYIPKVNGLDFNFCIPGEGMRRAAELYDPESGRFMTVDTDQPAIQIYSGQGLDIPGKGGAHYGAFAGIALETQHYPDSPNHEAFPTTRLDPGDTFTSTTQFRFQVK